MEIMRIRENCELDEISIAVKDEGRGFDLNKIADPTAPENTGAVHGPWDLPDESANGRRAL